MRYVITLIAALAFVTSSAWAEDETPADQPVEKPAPQEQQAAETPTEEETETHAEAETQLAEQDQTPTEAEQATPLTVTVVSVEGTAEQRLTTDEQGQWHPLEAGDELSELSIIRTGLGSQVVLKFSDRGEVVVRSATKVGIASFRKDDEQEVTTRLGLKYGSIHADVDSSEGPNDFQVATPVATLSVRGTGGGMGVSELGLGICGDVGIWNLDTPFGWIPVGAGQCSDDQATPWPTMLKSHLDTKTGDPRGLNPLENLNLIDNGGGRGQFGFFGNGFFGPTLFFPGGNSSNHVYHGENGLSGQ